MTSEDNNTDTAKKSTFQLFNPYMPYLIAIVFVAMTGTLTVLFSFLLDLDNQKIAGQTASQQRIIAASRNQDSSDLLPSSAIGSKTDKPQGDEVIPVTEPAQSQPANFPTPVKLPASQTKTINPTEA